MLFAKIIFTVGVLGLGAAARIPTPFSYVASPSLASFGVATDGQPEPTAVVEERRIPTPFSFVAIASPSLANLGVATDGQPEPTGIAPFTSSKKRNGGSVDLEERQGASTTCCPVGNFDWSEANFSDIMIGAEGIVAMDSNFNVGGNSCLQVACVSGSGIWACNQESSSMLINTLSIGAYAEALDEDCSSGGNACGQYFTGANWNVIIHGGC